MFAALMNRAQATVDNAIGQAINRALMAIPFILAGGFATAALAFKLVREFGPETANLILAGLFLFLGLAGSIIFRARAPGSSPTVEEKIPEALAGTNEAADAKPSLDPPDRELLFAAMSSAAPIAVPALLRTLIRNLPLVLAILSALFVLTRTAEEKSGADAATQ